MVHKPQRKCFLECLSRDGNTILSQYSQWHGHLDNYLTANGPTALQTFQMK